MKPSWGFLVIALVLTTMIAVIQFGIEPDARKLGYRNPSCVLGNDFVSHMEEC